MHGKKATGMCVTLLSLNHLFRASRPTEKQKETETDRNTETHSKSQADKRTDRQN